MRVRSPRQVPLRFAFPQADGREEGWGRFEDLAATGGRVLTRFRLEGGDVFTATFTLFGETFSETPARVSRAWIDADGYFAAEVRFTDEVVRRALSRVLHSLLARSGSPVA